MEHWAKMGFLKIFPRKLKFLEICDRFKTITNVQNDKRDKKRFSKTVKTKSLLNPFIRKVSKESSNMLRVKKENSRNIRGSFISLSMMELFADS